MKKLIISAVVIMSSLSAFADSSQVERCLDSATTDAARLKCAFEEFTRQDNSLNAEYTKLMTQLKKDKSDNGNEIINRVVRNQRAWITMRDTTCDVEAIDMLGGTDESLIISSCQSRMTEERTAKIIELQKSLGGMN